jgi:acyl-CoA thioester hydrolase
VQTQVSFPVRYFETDAQQVVYYANHLAWFELGYEALFAALGRPLALDHPLVLEATCRYRAPVRYGETVTVQSAPLRATGDDLWVAHTIRVGPEVRAVGATLLEGAGGLLPGPSEENVPERFAGWETLAPHGRREEFPLRVRYAETDPARGAHFARYLVWFEVGRIAFLHRVGLDYSRMETGGSPFVIAWAGCRYLSPVGFDTPLQIEVWVEEVRQQSFTLGYRLVHTEENRPIALGRTVQAFIGAARGAAVRAAPIPDWARALLLDGHAPDV